MAKLTLNLAPMQAARDGLAKQRLAQRDTAVRLKAAQAALDAALRSGASGDAVERQRAAVTALQNEGRAALADTAARLVALTKISERLRGRRDPADLVQALDTAHPVMLLPVAVQTRYNDAATQLMIRIYPDAIHTFGHEPGLSDSEIDAGKGYWTQRFAVPSDADSPWQQIARFYSPPRAAWLVRATTPTNVAAIGSAPNGELVDAAVRRRGDPARRPDHADGLRHRLARPLRRHRPGRRQGDLPQVGRRRSPTGWRCRRRSIRCSSTIPRTTIRSARTGPGWSTTRPRSPPAWRSRSPPPT